jgi:hypothetical protein
MPVIRIVLLLSVVGGLTLFAVSNLSPVLPVVFLGMTTVALPLAAWIGIAIAAGAITSFFLQFLSYLQRGYSPRRLEQPDEVPPRTRSYRRETPETPEPEPQTRYTPPPPPQTPSNNPASDWEERVDEDWDFDEESAAPASSQQDFERENPTSTTQTDPTSYEVKQEAKSGYQTGSVYSYSYRDTSESGVAKPDAVYDANYRVITPPYQTPSQKPPEPEDDDEDWGFEDDDEFDIEGESEPRRR